ncbi:MAG: hypothetical protein JWO87_1346 [Phycisphaerales bacterium]|nr:hypothetical protein [Phycisphaerales bacterium]
MESEPTPTPRATPTTAIIAAWAVVSIPLLWGVVQTLIKSLDLFKR